MKLIKAEIFSWMFSSTIIFFISSGADHFLRILGMYYSSQDTCVAGERMYCNKLDCAETPCGFCTILVEKPVGDD